MFPNTWVMFFQNLGTNVLGEKSPATTRKEILDKERPNTLRYPFIIDYYKE